MIKIIKVDKVKEVELKTKAKKAKENEAPAPKPKPTELPNHIIIHKDGTRPRVFKMLFTTLSYRKRNKNTNVEFLNALKSKGLAKELADLKTELGVMNDRNDAILESVELLEKQVDQSVTDKKELAEKIEALNDLVKKGDTDKKELTAEINALIKEHNSVNDKLNKEIAKLKKA